MCAAARLVPNVNDFFFTALRCIAMEMQCVICFLELQQEVVILNVLFNSCKDPERTALNTLTVEIGRKKRVLK